MKILFMALLAFGGSVGSVMATTHEHIVPTLQYDESYEVDEKMDNHQYLVVVPEVMEFPESKQKDRFERAQSILETIMNSEEF
jgi:basic membrane lipoprotein Med (substrate-binding protein (PBP1-ABC) superfamily)